MTVFVDQGCGTKKHKQREIRPAQRTASVTYLDILTNWHRNTTVSNERASINLTDNLWYVRGHEAQYSREERSQNIAELHNLRAELKKEKEQAKIDEDFFENLKGNKLEHRILQCQSC